MLCHNDVSECSCAYVADGFCGAVVLAWQERFLASVADQRFGAHFFRQP